MNENRADNFLRLIRRSQRGRLKIYMGYAAGVGKTYQMLLEGHRIIEDGVDLVVGFVETHGRAETEELVSGLVVIPRRKVTYHGVTIEEMDLDAILSRRPSVVLVDELAHTNVPGSRNLRRYQDVEELLSAGIHVISTMNIQHLESLYETVERATMVKVRERVPDRIVAESDQLVNVDVTVEDLRRRLQDGKVYTKERIETALNNFFKPTNLEQLRELTLRELAAQIDARRRDPMDEDIPSPDQVMVCLSSKGPNSEALLRYASRLAGRLNRNWYVVYVQTSKEGPMHIDSATQRLLSNTFTLAQQLGATVFTYKGEDVVKTILQFAKEYHVGHIVIGAPEQKIKLWKKIRGETSIVDRLVTESQGITLVVVSNPSIREQSEGESTLPQRVISDQKKEFAIESGTALSRATVLVWEESIDKEGAIRDLIESCRDLGDNLQKPAWESVLDRERQGETFVGEELMLPHAKIVGLIRPILAIGIGKEGIQDETSGRMVRIMILLLSPIDPPRTHLQMLASISKMALDDQWRKEVLAAKSQRDISFAIRKWDADHQSSTPIESR